MKREATPGRRPRVLFLITEDSYFVTHRLQLARRLLQHGYDIFLVTRIRRHGEVIRREGITLIESSLRREGRNPFRELMSIWQLKRIYQHVRPDIVHHVGVKPLLYGSMAAKLARVPAMVTAFAGLGYVFTSADVRARVMRGAIVPAARLLVNGSRSRIIVQNLDNEASLVAAGVASPSRVVLVRGAGVDLIEFAPSEELPGVPLVVLPARLLWDKGVGEFVGAARLLRNAGVEARFALVGAPDPANPEAVSDQQLATWKREGVVEVWGNRDDMPEVLRQSHIVCLPSYAEGLPKSLLEGAAAARAIVTTDVPGCREIVKEGENGLTVPARDVDVLAGALRRLIEDAALRRRMGEKGRQIVEQEFAIEHVVRDTLAIYEELLER